MAYETSFIRLFYKKFSMCSLGYAEFSFFKKIPLRNIKSSLCSMFTFSKDGCKIMIFFVKFSYVFKSKNFGLYVLKKKNMSPSESISHNVCTALLVFDNTMEIVQEIPSILHDVCSTYVDPSNILKTHDHYE